jgi:hypothetical protein
MLLTKRALAVPVEMDLMLIGTNATGSVDCNTEVYAFTSPSRERNG